MDLQLPADRRPARRLPAVRGHRRSGTTTARSPLASVTTSGSGSGEGPTSGRAVGGSRRRPAAPDRVRGRRCARLGPTCCSRTRRPPTSSAPTCGSRPRASTSPAPTAGPGRAEAGSASTAGGRRAGRDAKGRTVGDHGRPDRSRHHHRSPTSSTAWSSRTRCCIAARRRPALLRAPRRPHVLARHPAQRPRRPAGRRAVGVRGRDPQPLSVLEMRSARARAAVRHQGPLGPGGRSRRSRLARACGSSSSSTARRST